LCYPRKTPTRGRAANCPRDQKTLRIVDIAAETDTYYSVTGILLSPILIPATALLSGTYVAVNNTYHLGEEQLVCAAPQDTAQGFKAASLIPAPPASGRLSPRHDLQHGGYLRYP
jgi:hypothetical protein